MFFDFFISQVDDANLQQILQEMKNPPPPLSAIFTPIVNDHEGNSGSLAPPKYFGGFAVPAPLKETMSKSTSSSNEVNGFNESTSSKKGDFFKLYN
jgi:hypothetical protein